MLSSLTIVTSKPDMDKSMVTDQGRVDTLLCAPFYVLLIGVSILSDRVRQLNIQTRFAVDEDAWPPNQPQDFTPLLLVHHEGQYTFKPTAALQLAGSIQSGRPYFKRYPQDSHQSQREALDNSKTTKQLVDILAPLQQSDNAQFILVEGLPGIGKSLLLQEIAYNWAKGMLLQQIKLVLFIQLRSPAVQQVSLVADLFQLICEGDKKAPGIAAASSDHFFENKGKGLVFLFDGFDEFPEYLQKDSLITSILKRKVLPDCGLIVSSRPHASVTLRQQATIRVDILGFAKEERKLYIEQSLKGQPHAVRELTEYLEGNLTINGLCFIPFNMVILIYLYKQGIPLPSHSTQLYNYFICLTICRHLAKSGHPLDNTITDLASLPEPCNIIVKQLSKLALEGINNNKLIFTLAEMRAACPSIEGALDGFGLLQVVQHFGLTGKTMTFNFIHFSIQEFMAAHHITQLPPGEELRVLEAKFWSDIHSNMFAMYTSLTKGQRSAFKQFLSGGEDTIAIAEIFLKKQLKCLRLFRSFHEANDEAMYTFIQQAQIFDNKVIDLSDTSLSPYDIECVTLFLTCSPHKEWKKLNLSDCHIQDHHVSILLRDLMSHDVTITHLYLSCNGFTRSFSSSISDLTIHCRVEELDISGNRTIGEDPTLYNMLTHPSSRLVVLDMMSTSLSSPSAITLFTAISKGNKLKVLHIENNPITDEACDVIATTMKNNTSLVWLWMSHNKISGEAAQRLLQALYNNDTLERLWLPFGYGYTEDVKKRIRSLQEVINKNRENRGCQTELIIYC